MVQDKKSYVYVLTSKNHRALYIGVTSDLAKRVNEHKSKTVEGYSKRYNATILIYYEVYNDIETAILREKQLKGWIRKKKTDLITLHNPIKISIIWRKWALALWQSRHPLYKNRTIKSKNTHNYG